MNKYLEVSIHTPSGFDIYDHTHYIEMFSNIANHWEVADMEKRYKFHTIRGKEITYHIMGLNSYEQSRQFAIWYHVNYASGNIRTYRLD